MRLPAPSLKRARSRRRATLEGRGGTAVEAHALIHRPWGWFRTLTRNSGFQVKEIFVRPGGKLSLQRHRHRAEQWIVASGEALATVANRELRLGPRGYVDIPPGVIHRLENRSDEPLRVVEVQVGEYLGEDDIERLADEYGRVEGSACLTEQAASRAAKA